MQVRRRGDERGRRPRPLAILNGGPRRNRSRHYPQVASRSPPPPPRPLWAVLVGRYHDTTLAFITAHYAADRRGRKSFSQRNADACDTLKKLCLVDSKEGFDVHLQVRRDKGNLAPRQALDTRF